MKELVNKIYRAYQKRQRSKSLKILFDSYSKREYEIKNNNTLNKETKQQWIYFLLRHTYVKMQLIRAQPYKKFFTKTGGIVTVNTKSPRRKIPLKINGVEIKSSRRKVSLKINGEEISKNND